MNEKRHDQWFVTLATMGFLGRIPKAPGTFGSLPGLVMGGGLYALFHHLLNMEVWSFLTIFIKISILALVSWFSCKIIAKTESYWQTHDSKEIVIDEVCGQMLPILFLGIHLEIILISFITFRFFDVLKPWPVSYFDREWHGPAGTLFDDLAAGILALFSSFFLVRFFL